MKYIILLISLFCLSGRSFSQVIPGTYELSAEKKLAKISAENPSSSSISDIITVGNTIWLGTGSGVSLSTDRGETWTNFSGDQVFGDLSISAIGYNNGAFWAATAKSVEVAGGSTLPEGQGLRYTTNNGTTWNVIPQSLDDPGDSTIVYGINDGINLPRVRALPVTVAINNLTYDIAFTTGTIWTASFAGGLRKSTDNGQTWQRVLLPSDEVNEISPDDTIRFALQPVAGGFGPDDHLNHRVFSVVAVNDTLYAGTAGGINKSTDNGISWRKFSHQNQLNPISGNFVVALAYNHTNNTLWGATWRAEGSDEFYGVSYTADGGENWKSFLADERVHNFGFSFDDVIAPSDNGPFRSSNLGTTWILPNSIFDQESDVPLLTTTFYSAASSGNYIWLGSNNGLARLTENVTTMWSGTWKVYFASLPLRSAEETYAYPNPFSPRLDNLKIKYSTGSRDLPVTIRIFDFDMNLVKTVIQNASRNRSLDDAPELWDGRDEKGNIVANGVYFYSIEVDNDDPVFGKVIVIQ